MLFRNNRQLAVVRQYTVRYPIATDSYWLLKSCQSSLFKSLT